ncbi:MAG: hypothetical protein KJP18_10705 [Gemmatimonadetes bacterium]|nr:hypothetical protein [Gemmatimonadota bacterium]
MQTPETDGERALRLRDLDDQETSNSASAWRHGRRALVALVLAGVFGSYAGEVGPQAYSIAAALSAWGALSGTRVVKAVRRLRAARDERDHLLTPGADEAGAVPDS